MWKIVYERRVKYYMYIGDNVKLHAQQWRRSPNLSMTYVIVDCIAGRGPPRITGARMWAKILLIKNFKS